MKQHNKLPMPPMLKKAGREACRDAIATLYDESSSLKVYMLFCRVMEKLWNWHNKWIVHKGKYGMREWLCGNQRHNPWNRAYNRIKDFEKGYERDMNETTHHHRTIK